MHWCHVSWFHSLKNAFTQWIHFKPDAESKTCLSALPLHLQEKDKSGLNWWKKSPFQNLHNSISLKPYWLKHTEPKIWYFCWEQSIFCFSTPWLVSSGTRSPATAATGAVSQMSITKSLRYDLALGEKESLFLSAFPPPPEILEWCRSKMKNITSMIFFLNWKSGEKICSTWSIKTHFNHF